MKLHIENFAKIANADIEINGITVIAGENNTGKSTVGKVLYSLYQSFHNLQELVLVNYGSFDISCIKLYRPLVSASVTLHLQLL